LGEQATFVRGTLLGGLLVAGAAVIGLAAWGRWAWAIGFAVGALVSLGNFQLIAHAVGGVAGVERGRALSTLWRGVLFRFGISGAVMVVALLLVRVSIPALAAGLVITQVTMIVLWFARALHSHT
jgi:hypothetical protein